MSTEGAARPPRWHDVSASPVGAGRNNLSVNRFGAELTLPSTAVDSVKNDSSWIGLSKLIGQADSIMLS
uniref:Uncharacterized protein n=1 Tax=Oryza rufipogon TaxID=4529 RepID=A0A0E0QMU6_ORYRU